MLLKDLLALQGKLPLSAATIARNSPAGGQPVGAQLEHRPFNAVTRPDAAQEGYPCRYRVRYHLRRVKLLDADNPCLKWHTDSLVWFRIIPGDSLKYVEIEVTQEKVTFANEATIIDIIPLGPLPL